MGKLGIKKRGKYYQYQFEIARVKGQRKWYTKSGFNTKEEALEAGNIALNEYLTAGKPFKEYKTSYSDYLDYWYNNYCLINLKYNTIKSYKTIIEKYIKPRIGYYKLSTITSVTLNKFIIDLVREYNFSKSYFKNILKVIKGSFREACNTYGFIKYNPSLTIRLPKIDEEYKEKHLYTIEEIDKILKRFKDDKTFTCAFLTSCFTGMRTAEVFALTWDDIDLENGIININHDVYDKKDDGKGRWYIGSTKTINSKRKIYITNTLKSALINYKERQDKLKILYGNTYKYYHLENITNSNGKILEQRIILNNNNLSYNNINLVFVRDDGTYSGTDLIRYPYKIIHDELNIKNCRFYDLRGSYATKILNEGVEIKNVSKILGHSKIETTENYYIRTTKDSIKESQNMIDNIIKSDIINKTINYKIDN